MVETSFAADDELVKIAALIAQPLEHVTKIGAGRNSRVYKIVQVTGEEYSFSNEQFQSIFNLAQKGILHIIQEQKKAMS